MTTTSPMPKDSGTTIPRYHSFEDFYSRSPFWRRLREFDRADGNQLRTTIQHVAEDAQAIATKIIACMPFYTLHDERHLLNLLGWLEVFTPAETLAQMPPLEIGLCLLGVLVHDLGMAQPLGERRAIAADDPQGKDRQAFDRFAQGRFGEELRLAQRLEERKEPGGIDRARLIRQHILSAYLRSTHASPGADRIRRWLAEMKKVRGERLFQYGSTDYEHELVLIAASHNQPVDWLRERLRTAGAFHRVVGHGERVSFAFPGLLLRLADIMDFDSSRTPSILYRHLGLDEDLGLDLAVSRNEWNKHLAITGIERKPLDGQPTVVYAASDCPHPVVEKSIRTFVDWIAEELRGVREELARQRRDPDLGGERFELTLPEVKAEIVPRKKDGRPTYLFEDIQFRLDQEEILQLLTGENLYGDPSLCIRELLQNALDACELRDLRLQMRAKGEAGVEPVDGTPIPERRGWFRDSATGQEQRLEVRLTWGFDEAKGQYWLQVEDNGVGMTEDVIRRYFTQIGKSYYTSPEFRQEQAALRSAGLLATPISQFGIGILSCFMLADRIEVRTCPGGHGPDRPPRDITVSGPGSLFWLRDGTRTTQGTEVKLWLKQKLKNKPLKLVHDPDRWLAGLRQCFGYIEVPFEEGPAYWLSAGSIDPAYTAGLWIVWPRFPLVVQGPSSLAFELNDRFHFDHLASIDGYRLRKTAAEWDVPAEQLGDVVRWGYWDWEDCDHDEATGSRVRLWFPCNHSPTDLPFLPTDPLPASGHCRQRELAALLEPQLTSTKAAYHRTLLHGVFVPNAKALEPAGRIGTGPGAGVWIDLRGAAALRLTTDRKTAAVPDEAALWYRCIEGIISRFFRSLGEHVRCWPTSSTNVVAGWWADQDVLEGVVEKRRARTTHDWWSTLQRVPTTPIAWPVRAFEQHLELNRRFDGQVGTFLYGCSEFARHLERNIERHFVLALALAHDAARSVDEKLVGACARGTNHELDLQLVCKLDLQLADDLFLVREFDLARAVRTYERVRFLSVGLQTNCLQEAFRPYLSGSWPWLELYLLKGNVADASLLGPTLLDFRLDADGCTVHPADLEGREPKSLVQREYDLVFPTTAVPLSQLRRRCLAWRKSAKPRRLGVLPFIVPSVCEFTADDLSKMRDYFHVDRIYALLPAYDLWSVPFADWTAEQWNHPENVSALWDLNSGAVLWAHGTGDLAWIRRTGQPPKQFFDWPDEPQERNP